jgi:hypothetical protein
MVVAWSEIRAVRRVVKQLPIEMLQQCLSAVSCMVQRSFFSVSQYMSDVTVVRCCMNFTISTPFLYQKTVAISFLADSI